MVARARRSRIERMRGDARVVVDDDAVADEAPLEIQVFDSARGVYRALAVLMRSPDDEDDDDADLVYGFLLTEGVVVDVDDVVACAACTTAPTPEAEGNVWRVRLRDGVDVDWARLQRNTFASSSCGVCGKASIDAACDVRGVVDSGVVVDAAAIDAVVAALRVAQPTFARTGGVHGAAIADAAGAVVAVAEDVGRHNAVDKVIGRALRRRAPVALLVVSGRVSFEVVQKAVAAGVAVVAGVGAPTALAVDLGARAGVCVVGFLRDGGCNLYSRTDRVRSQARGSVHDLAR